MDPWHTGLTTLAFVAVLSLPVAPVARAAEWQYKAQPGDTPLKICRSFTRSPRCSLSLARLNDLPPRAPIAPGTTVRIPAEWLKEVPIVGGVIETSAGAQYKPVDSADFAPLNAGEPVYLGDTIRTAEGAAVLEFVSGLMIEVRPHSLLVLQSVVDLAESPVVNVDLASGAATVASSGESADALAASALPTGADSADAGAQLVAGVERLLEEQPTAAGHAKAPSGAPAAEPGNSVAQAMRAVLARLGIEKGARNTFEPAAIAWPRGEGAEAWRVEVLALPRRLELAQSYTVDEPALALPDLPVGCYEVKIHPIDAAGNDRFARRESLCVHPALAAPRLRGEVSLDGSGLRVVWDRVAFATGYEVQLAADPAFGRVLRTLPASGASVRFRPASAEERFVRVRARNAAGMSGPASEAIPLTRYAATGATAEPPS